MCNIKPDIYWINWLARKSLFEDFFIQSVTAVCRKYLRIYVHIHTKRARSVPIYMFRNIWEPCILNFPDYCKRQMKSSNLTLETEVCYGTVFLRDIKESTMV